MSRTPSLGTFQVPPCKAKKVLLDCKSWLTHERWGITKIPICKNYPAESSFQFISNDICCFYHMSQGNYKLNGNCKLHISHKTSSCFEKYSLTVAVSNAHWTISIQFHIKRPSSTTCYLIHFDKFNSLNKSRLPNSPTRKETKDKIKIKISLRVKDKNKASFSKVDSYRDICAVNNSRLTNFFQVLHFI